MKELYEAVFEKDGSVKLCGRSICSALIKEMSDKHPGINFGDIETGVMNIANIQKVYKENY